MYQSQFAHYMDYDDDALEHFGVKGMKWGVRKHRRADLDKPNADYTDNMRRRDNAYLPNKSVKRINRRVNKGQSVRDARAAEKSRHDAIVMMELSLAATLVTAGPIAVQALRTDPRVKNMVFSGARAAGKAFGKAAPTVARKSAAAYYKSHH